MISGFGRTRRLAARLAGSTTVLAALTAGLASALMMPSCAHAQSVASTDYPNKPLRFVVPYPAGGPLDTVARALAEKMRDNLGQPVVVDNKPGAGGNIGAELVAKSAPDGYTIVMGAVATHAINPSLYRRMPYDALKDFAPITRVASVPNVLVMTPEAAQKLNVTQVKDLILWAKANPGKLNYASGGNGSAGHLAGEMLKTAAGIDMTHIPYQGAGPAQLGLMSGQTDLMFDNLASAAAQIKAGKLKAFAVTTAQRNRQFPDLPTMVEAGVRGFDIDTWFGVFAPAQTPEPVIQRLYQAITQAMSHPDVRDRMGRLAAEPAPLAPQAFAAFVQTEMGKYAALVKQSGAVID